MYPALRDLAISYAAYLTRTEDGAYHAIPAMSAEHWGRPWRFERNPDSASALSLIKWTLKSAAAAAQLLGRDAGLREEWLRVVRRMAPYPMAEGPGGTVYTDVAGVTPALLADEISLVLLLRRFRPCCARRALSGAGRAARYSIC